MVAMATTAARGVAIVEGARLNVTRRAAIVPKAVRQDMWAWFVRRNALKAGTASTACRHATRVSGAHVTT